MCVSLSDRKQAEKISCIVYIDCLLAVFSFHASGWCFPLHLGLLFTPAAEQHSWKPLVQICIMSKCT